MYKQAKQTENWEDISFTWFIDLSLITHSNAICTVIYVIARRLLAKAGCWAHFPLTEWFLSHIIAAHSQSVEARGRGASPDRGYDIRIANSTASVQTSKQMAH